MSLKTNQPYPLLSFVFLLLISLNYRKEKSDTLNTPKKIRQNELPYSYEEGKMGTGICWVYQPKTFEMGMGLRFEPIAILDTGIYSKFG